MKEYVKISPQDYYMLRLCTEAAFAASFAHSSGLFMDLDFAFGVFSGESFAVVSFMPDISYL